MPKDIKLIRPGSDCDYGYSHYSPQLWYAYDDGGLAIRYMTNSLGGGALMGRPEDYIVLLSQGLRASKTITGRGVYFHFVFVKRKPETKRVLFIEKFVLFRNKVKYKQKRSLSHLEDRLVIISSSYSSTYNVSYRQ